MNVPTILRKPSLADVYAQVFTSSGADTLRDPRPRWGLWAALALFCGDMLFVGVYSIANNESTRAVPPMWRLDLDGGFAEIYQYFKFALAGGGCLWLAWRWRQWMLAAWGGLFLALTLDDAMQGHERIGLMLAGWGWVGDWGPLGANHVGELMGFAVLEGPWLLLIAVGWCFAPRPATRLSLWLVPALGALVAAGMVIDALSAAGVMPFKRGLIQLEDGGEMVAASLMLAVVFSAVVAAWRMRRVPTPRLS